MSGFLCICDQIPKLQTRTRVIVIMHYAEAATSSNTARLAHLSLPESSEIRLRGLKDAPLNEEGLLTPKAIGADHPTLLLFPTDNSVELTPEMAAKLPGIEKGLHLIVPDGNWKQAARMPQRIPSLKHPSVIPVRLPDGGPPSSYQLRTPPRESAVCTIEAIARALGILEGPEQGPLVQATLERIFQQMVERVMWSRGKIKTQDCKFPIPEAAVQSFFEAGKRGGPV